MYSMLITYKLNHHSILFKKPCIDIFINNLKYPQRQNDIFYCHNINE